MMVEEDPGRVEATLTAGGFSCGACVEGRLRPWGFARRRSLRDRGGVVVVRPRRGRCALCLVTTVLLPTVAFFRRRDVAEVIGGALHARFVEHKTRAQVIAEAGVHPDTVRGWLRRFVARAEEIRVLFSSWAHRFDASLGPITARGSPAGDAMEAIGVAAAAAGRRLGPAPLWSFVAGASGGLLLSNTSCLLRAGS
jgi:hypothetical protein